MAVLSDERTLSTGNQQSIADEHRLLAEQVDWACLAIDKFFSEPGEKSRSDISSLLHILGDLIETAEAHFYHEEVVMKKDGFSGLFLHKRDHDDLLRKLNGFASSLSGGRLAGPVRMSGDVRGWLAEHAKNFDDPYVAFANCCKQSGSE
jgi:hemerythrin-like metal-binding protein